MSLRWRVSLVVALIVSVVVVFTAVGARVLVERQMLAETDEVLAGRAASIPPVGRGRGQANVPRRRELDGTGYDVELQWLDRNGDVLLAVSGDPQLPVDDRSLELAVSGGRTAFQTVEIDGTRYRVVTRSYPGRGAIMVARDLSEADQVLAALRTSFILLGIAGIGVAAAVAWEVARRVDRPIEQLTLATENVTRSGELHPIEIDRSDEVGRLATSFNAMLAALATSRHQQQRLVQDASHELRTPLTSLRTNIELLLRESEIENDERDEILRDVHLELQELTSLSEELVALASESSRASEVRGSVDLGDLAQAVVEKSLRRFQRKMDLVRSGCSELEGQPMALERAISNLVDNAVKFSPPDALIEVQVDGLRLSVRDWGPGISSDDETRIFDRFYRSDEARSAPGSGLGLAIVEQVVMKHGGAVFVESPADGGAIVGFDLSSN
ncbi:MAG: ATP-binding protein [Acidimicrobiales bacterium]